MMYQQDEDTHLDDKPNVSPNQKPFEMDCKAEEFHHPVVDNPVTSYQHEGTYLHVKDEDTRPLISVKQEISDSNPYEMDCKSEMQNPSNICQCGTTYLQQEEVTALDVKPDIPDQNQNVLEMDCRQAECHHPIDERSTENCSCDALYPQLKGEDSHPHLVVKGEILEQKPSRMDYNTETPQDISHRLALAGNCSNVPTEQPTLDDANLNVNDGGCGDIYIDRDDGAYDNEYVYQDVKGSQSDSSKPSPEFEPPEEGTHKSSLCEKTLQESRGRQHQSLTDTGESRNVCPVCGMSFNRVAKIKSHIESCLRRGDQTKMNKKHLSSPCKTFQCLLCTESFNEETAYASHLTVRHGSSVISGGLSCGDSYSSSYKGRKNRRDALSRRTKKVVIRAMTSGSGSKDDWDGRNGKSDGTIINAANSSISKRDVEDDGGRNYKNNTTAISDSTSRCNANIFRCPICKSHFRQKQGLKTHLLVHTSEKPFKCGLCSRAFKTKGNLNQHVMIHSEENKKHKCSMCLKAFYEKKSLETHKRIHSGEKPYEYSECSRKFSDRSAFNAHVKTHKGIRPHKCSLCGACFLKKGNLKTHMRVHSGDKPYKCSVCGQEFSRQRGVKDHMKTHTKKER